MIRVAVIGYGYLGKWHCQKVEHSPLAELKYIIDPSLESRKIAQSAHPSSVVLDSYIGIENEVDAYFVVTPTSTHLEIFSNLIRLNKYIFCEKPFSDNLESSLTLYQQYLDQSHRVMIGHSERCHKIWETLSIDNTGFIELRREAPFKSRALDVSVIDDLMIHDIDLIHYLSGSDIKKVKAHGIHKRENKFSEEYVEVSGITHAGLNFRLVSDRDSYHPQRSFTYHQLNKSCFIDLQNATIKNELSEMSSYEPRDHLQFQHDCFYQSIIHSTKFMTSWEDGLKAMMVVDAIKRSLKNSCDQEVKTLL